MPGSVALKSSTSSAWRPRLRANSSSATITPASAPWNDMPPCQIFNGYQASACHISRP